MKMLGIHFSYNEKLKDEKLIYDVITNIQHVLKRESRNLTLEGKVVIFKTTPLSKIIFLTPTILLGNCKIFRRRSYGGDNKS